MLRVRITNLNEVDEVRVALNGDELDQTPGGADGFRKINEMCERRPTLVAVFSFPSHVERPNPAGPDALPHQTASS